MKNKVFDELIVVKRSGQRVNFNGTKIAIAIKSAFEDTHDNLDENKVNQIYENVLNNIYENYQDRKTINVEDIQDIIEYELKKDNIDVYEKFQDYRTRRAASREAFSIKQTHKFVKAVETIGLTAKNKLNDKPLELIRRFGKIISKEFAVAYLLDNKSLRSNDEGAIYINNLDCYSLGNIAGCNISLDSIKDYELQAYFIELTNLIIASAKDVYKEVVVSNFDTILKRPLLKELKKLLLKNINIYLEPLMLKEYIDNNLLISYIESIETIEFRNDTDLIKNEAIKNIFEKAFKNSLDELKNILINNLKMLFNALDILDNKVKITISLDNEKSLENEFIISNYLSVEIPKKIITNIYLKNNLNTLNLVAEGIFNKKQIHLVNEDVNCNYFSTGEKVYENINDESTSIGRTINAQNTINLCRCALKAKNEKEFFELLSDMLDICKNALQQRYELQANKYKNTYNVIFNPNILFASEKIEDKQKVRKVIRNGNLYIGYVGIVEAVLILNKQEKFGEAEQKLLFKIIDFMNDKCMTYTQTERLNFKICEIYDNHILQDLIKIDKSIYGITKLLDKSKYDDINDYINDLKVLAKYQDKTSCLIKIKLLKKNIKQIENALEDILKLNIKYAKVEV
ncbi:MAG: hypothetical protein IJO33_01780 [Bacilli bacterium]|nr:hypothetical protein [Bacilli bacterium]